LALPGGTFFEDAGAVLAEALTPTLHEAPNNERLNSPTHANLDMFTFMISIKQI
jgi:hypothetical protein